MNSIIKKLKKFYKDSDLFFYDMFKKRIERKQLKISTNVVNSNYNFMVIDSYMNSVNKRISKLEYILFDVTSENISTDNVWDSIINKYICSNYESYLINLNIFFKNINLCPLNCDPLEYQFGNSEIAIIHGQTRNPRVMSLIAYAKLHNLKICHTEDGFIHSIVRPVDSSYDELYRIGCSMSADFKTNYFDATQSSNLEEMLNQKIELSDEEYQRARSCIDFLIKNYISKYNNQPIYTPNIGRNGVKKVLVIDQACNDWSIKKGYCSPQTFIEMLETAIEENKNSDILVKIHPDMIQNSNRGGAKNKKWGHYTDFDFQKYTNVYLISDYINPISLLKYVDVVHVCTSQMGFESLLLEKETHIWGVPYYAGWGVGIQRKYYPALNRRKTQHSVEEIFYTAYIKYSRYINPLSRKVCSIEEAMTYILQMRNKFFSNFNIINEYRNLDIETNLNSVVDIAFCFDKNNYKQAIVSSMSLLDSSDKETSYNIHYIIDDSLIDENCQEILTYINKHHACNSTKFYKTEYIFENGYETRGISKATYYRLIIHKILSDIDKVIYSDVDVIFNGTLKEIFDMDISGYMIGGCPDIGLNSRKLFEEKRKTLPYWDKYFKYLKGNYINAGFLLMNLKKIRDSNIESKWIELSIQKFEHQDQDIINATCNKNILKLNGKYNVIPRYVKNGGYDVGVKEKFIPSTYLDDIKNAPVVYHYAGKKPWNNKNVEGASIWWEYIKKYPDLFSYFSLRYEKRLV